jgi:hypothetical protein
MSAGGPLFGSGGFFGGQGGYGPQGPYGAWPACGCSSFFIILAGILLIFGGCMRMFNM